MGRGRAKAKQTRVARELKYSSPNTDLSALQRELAKQRRGLGVRAEDVPRLAELTLGDACLTTNPREADEADVHQLFMDAL